MARPLVTSLNKQTGPDTFGTGCNHEATQKPKA